MLYFISSTLDIHVIIFYISAHKLEVTQLHGVLGEEVTLYTRLESSHSATKWLSVLEQHMKTTLQLMLEACVQARLEDGRCIYWLYLCMSHDHTIFLVRNAFVCFIGTQISEKLFVPAYSGSKF